MMYQVPHKSFKIAFHRRRVVDGSRFNRSVAFRLVSGAPCVRVISATVENIEEVLHNLKKKRAAAGSSKRFIYNWLVGYMANQGSPAPDGVDSNHVPLETLSPWTFFLFEDIFLF